jgi:Flp pilus assembly protein TadD
MDQSAIFVSHSSKDKAFCDLLISTLGDAGFDAWAHEHDTSASESIAERIGTEIGRRPTFVILLSPAALESYWVRKEWGIAMTPVASQPGDSGERSTGRKIIPVTVQPLIDEAFTGPWQFVKPIPRIEGQNYQPLSTWDAIGQVLARLDVSADALLTRGKDLNRTSHFHQAIPLLRLVTMLRPSDYSGWISLAWAELEAGEDYPHALASSERAAILRPDKAEAWNAKGWALNRLRLHAAALVAAEQALRFEEGQAYIWGTKASALQGLGRLEEALEASERATVVGSSWKWGWHEKARILRALGRIEEAEIAEQRYHELT